MTSWTAAARAAGLFVGHVTPDAVGDVVADGAREEERLLLDDADLAAQVASGVLRQWLAVQSDRPAGRLARSAAAG
ncbi:MAG: hypothetical protein M9927_18520 [Anaerolineae bacterium]|nr:hypothetical protein [Anaerolineae bacterium]